MFIVGKLATDNSSHDIWLACFKSFFKDLPFLKVLYWLPVRWKCVINPTVLGTFPRVCQIMCLHYRQKIRVTLWIVLYWPVLLSSKKQFWSWFFVCLSSGEGPGAGKSARQWAPAAGRAEEKALRDSRSSSGSALWGEWWHVHDSESCHQVAKTQQQTQHHEETSLGTETHHGT